MTLVLVTNSDRIPLRYEDILNPRDIYSLIALTAYHNGHFGICSRAFIKLETMPAPPNQVERTSGHNTLARHPVPHAKCGVVQERSVLTLCYEHVTSMPFAPLACVIM